MSISKQDLLDDVDAIVAARDTRDAAHAATLSALQHVTDVTVIEQANIDSATAQFDRNTRDAQASADSAGATEDVAKTADKAALDKFVADVQAFDAGS
ncbi:MAG: hypothetical protein V4479_01890 [Actinomycetota bacterium]